MPRPRTLGYDGCSKVIETHGISDNRDLVGDVMMVVLMAGST